MKRRALEALTELKWAGKPGADSSGARPGPPAPLFVGEGKETPGVPVLGSRTPHRRNRCPPVPSKGPPQASGGRVSQGGRGGSSSPSVRTVGARRAGAANLRSQRAGGARRACVRWERASRPFPERVRSSPPPRVPQPPPQSLPPQPARSARGRRPVSPVHRLTPSPQFRPASAELRYKLRSQGLAFRIPASALPLPPNPRALPANCRAARLLSVCGRGTTLYPSSLCLACSILQMGNSRSTPGVFFQNEARELPYWKGKPRLSTI